MGDKTYFDILNGVNVNGKTEKKGRLTYLSWVYAVGEVTKRYPDMEYRIITDPQTNLPYFYDPDTGYMVMTEVTIEGHTKQMWLPVMDNRNHALFDADMFNINTSIMRCLTKNFAMFGLGLYIYAGEDLPESEREKQDPNRKIEQKDVDVLEAWIKRTNTDRDSFVSWAGKEIADFTMQDYSKAFYFLKAKEEKINHTQKEIRV